MLFNWCVSYLAQLAKSRIPQEYSEYGLVTVPAFIFGVGHKFPLSWERHDFFKPELSLNYELPLVKVSNSLTDIIDLHRVQNAAKLDPLPYRFLRFIIFFIQLKHARDLVCWLLQWLLLNKRRPRHLKLLLALLGVNTLSDPIKCLVFQPTVATKVQAAQSLGASEQGNDLFDGWFNQASHGQVEVHQVCVVFYEVSKAGNHFKVEFSQWHLF